MKRLLEQSQIRELPFERYLPHIAVTVILALAIALGLNLTLLRGDVKTNKATIGDLCTAVTPVRAVFEVVLGFPPDPTSPTTPEQRAAFRAELRRGIHAIDGLDCPQQP